MTADTRRSVWPVVVAIIFVGAAIVLAIVLTRPRAQVFETNSSQQAWEHASAGWYCEDRGKPIDAELLGMLAHAGLDGTSTDSKPEFRCSHP